MNKVFVVYYEVYYPYDTCNCERLRIECVVDSVEKARAKIDVLNKRVGVSYADYELFDVE
jgi:hypothetical protein